MVTMSRGTAIGVLRNENGLKMLSTVSAWNIAEKTDEIRRAQAGRTSLLT
jgi:hypothetical protein